MLARTVKNKNSLNESNGKALFESFKNTKQ